jgi:muramoyltetrapeptide carboxypeptidase LdcA involved in peptidoglycan recycling
MIKPRKLQPGDKIAIVSLSSGVLGESFVDHELVLGERRLKEFGLEFDYMPNSRKGIEYIKANPHARAEDLKRAFMDDSFSAIFCAIGGDDTYRTIPYLLDDPEFIQAVKDNPKIFLGFSDTTNNHLMFYKLGLQTYYGQAFLTDLAEFASEMLPYTKEWMEQLLRPTTSKEITSSPTWYEERKSFDKSQVGVDRIAHDEMRGYEILRGSGSVRGRLLGGCIESLYDQLTGDRYIDERGIIEKYEIFPPADEWRGKILFAETSEEKPTPEKLKVMLKTLMLSGVFENIQAIIVGKPQDETFYNEYKNVWLKATEEWNIPILYNFNIGHAVPRCILPYGGEVEINFDNKTVLLDEPLVCG